MVLAALGSEPLECLLNPSEAAATVPVPRDRTDLVVPSWDSELVTPKEVPRWDVGTSCWLSCGPRGGALPRATSTLATGPMDLMRRGFFQNHLED